MPFLDVMHLFFKPAATIEEVNSIFCKEWNMTLEYVLRQSGLKDVYTSSMSEERDLFVFLIWVSEDDRSHFYHQTTGFGFLSERMRKPPSVFFFGEDDYAKLDETEWWTIDVLIARSRDAADLQRISELQEKPSLRYAGQYKLLARQDRAEFEKLYEGNTFDYALIGITTTDSNIEPASTSSSKPECYKIELRKREKSSYPAPLSSTIKAPVDVADLTSKQPWEYGVLSSDEGEFKDTAYPMSLSFKPMSTLHRADSFLPEKSHQTSMDKEAADQYTMCIVSVAPQLITESQSNESSFGSLREKLGLLDDLEGLREVRVLRAIARSDGSELVRLACTWNTSADLTKWWQDFTTSRRTGSNANTKIECTWTSDRLGWVGLQWNSMPLTRDKQHWQKVNKIMEAIEFNFAQDLPAAEKTAFEGRVHALMDMMSSCWSGDIDERPVVYAETPVWTTSEDAPSSCLLFLAWDGTEQRRAWLLNFMANSFEWTGYITHILSIVCSSVDSEIYEMEQLYTWRENCESTVGCNVDDDDSERDMGF